MLYMWLDLLKSFVDLKWVFGGFFLPFKKVKWRKQLQ